MMADECLVDSFIDSIGRLMIQDLECGRFLAFDVAFIERSGIVLQPSIQPLIRLFAEREDICMGSVMIVLLDLVRRAVQFIDRAGALVDVVIPRLMRHSERLSH